MLWKCIYLAVLFLLSGAASTVVLTFESPNARMLGLVVLAVVLWSAVEVDRAFERLAAKRRGCACKCHD